jgi:hypothetical protein
MGLMLGARLSRKLLLAVASATFCVSFLLMLEYDTHKEQFTITSRDVWLSTFLYIVRPRLRVALQQLANPPRVVVWTTGVTENYGHRLRFDFLEPASR